MRLSPCLKYSPRRLTAQDMGMTHFLCIPLSTSTSRPMFSDAYRNIMNDPLSSSIPKPAFKYPEELHISLALLNLGAPQRLDQALNLLRTRDYEGILDNTFHSYAANTQCPAKTVPSSHSILEVAVKGLYLNPLQPLSPHPDPKKSIHLHASVSDRSQLLPRVCADIFQMFRDADLVANNITAGSRDQVQHLLRGLFTQMVSTKRLHTIVDNLDPSSEKMDVRFDPTDLLHKHRDLIWAEPFKLEKLSIRELGLQDIFRDGRLISRGYKEIGSVPLPGAPIVQPEPWLEGATYVKHRKPHHTSPDRENLIVRRCLSAS